MYQTRSIPVVRDTVFNEKHKSFSHIGKKGVYRVFLLLVKNIKYGMMKKDILETNKKRL